MTAAPDLPVDRRPILLGALGATETDPMVLGAKAANLVRIADAGVPVPPAFVLDTSVCAAYHAAGGVLDAATVEAIDRGVEQLQRATGCRFGAPRRPMLVSVRSGAPVSMPGMLATVVDVGLCDSTLPGLLRATGDPVFAWDSYRRLVESLAEALDGEVPAAFATATETVLGRAGVPTVAELDVAALRELVALLLAARPLPVEPRAQLLAAVEGVLRSWMSPRAVEYRRLQGLDALPGTAVIVQAMVYGNLGARSGSGVGFTRDPATGEHRLYLDFVLGGQGDDVVAGRDRAVDPAPLLARIPGLDAELHATAEALERLFADAQDFEFTVEEGRLWLLQTRTAKRTPWAALQIACDLVDAGIIDPATAVARMREYDLDAIVRTRLARGSDSRPVARGTPAGPGVATGHVALDTGAATRLAGDGQRVVLVRPEASTADIAALPLCAGLLTATGARTSHAIVVARQLGLACVVGCRQLRIDPSARTVLLADAVVGEGDVLTVDGTTGEVHIGAVEVVEERPQALVARITRWQSQTH